MNGRIRWNIWWRRWGATAATIVLVCLGIALRLGNLQNVKGRTPDESVYTKQANALLDRGKEGIRDLTAEYQRDPTMRLFPPPTRIGYLWMLATTMRLAGNRDVSAGAYLSCAASIGSLLLLALFGLRYFPGWATVIALLFFAVFPAELELSRRTWGDALVGFLSLALICVSAQIARDSRRPLWYVLFVLLGSFGVLFKESWPIVLGLCAVWVFWTLLIQLKDWRNALILLAGGAAGMGLSVAWLASTVGGFSVVSGIIPNLMHANAANPYAVEYQSGPGYLLLQAVWILTPLAALLCPLGLGIVFPFSANRKWPRDAAITADWEVMTWTGIFLISFFAIPMVLPHWLNLRYLSPVFGPFCLMAGVALWYCVLAGWNRIRTVGRAAVALLILALLAGATWMDYQRFQTMFVRNEVGDLSIKLLLDPQSRVIPDR